MLKIQQQSVEDLILKEIDEGKGYQAITERFHNSVIVGALTRTRGNVSRAAILLKVHRNNLIRWMRESGIDRHFYIEEEKSDAAKA